MIRLYYFPQLASISTRIVLEEIGLPYELVKVDIPSGENRRPEHLARNPAGQVPVLQIDDIYLVETIAIMDYLTSAYPDAKLAPTEPAARARWIAAMARIASAFHPTFALAVRPGGLVPDQEVQGAVSKAARERYLGHLAELEAKVSDDAWLLGDQYTTADAHAMLIYNWGDRAKFPLEKFPKLNKWKDRMLARPAVARVLEAEGSGLIAQAA